jgi:hypothetical protein
MLQCAAEEDVVRMALTGTLLVGSVGLLTALSGTALVVAGQAQGGDPTGRWVFTSEAAPARGRGNTTPAKQTIILQLELGPGNSVTGTLDPGPGRAPGNNPQRPVEISDGRIDGRQLTFSAWEFDGYKNRIHYVGEVAGDALDLTMTRETPTGPKKTSVKAVRQTGP